MVFSRNNRQISHLSRYDTTKENYATALNLQLQFYIDLRSPPLLDGLNWFLTSNIFLKMKM